MERCKDKFLLFIKAAIVGIAGTIHGVSVGTLALSLGIYEIILESIANLSKNIKKYGVIILIFILGVTAGAISGTQLVSYLLDNYPMQTTFLFFGLIFGGLRLITKKTRGKLSFSNVAVFLISFAFVILLSFINPVEVVTLDNIVIADYFKLFFMGFIGIIAAVIPGISGTFILVLFGYYEIFIKTLSNLFSTDMLLHNLQILIPFLLGAILGIILISKLSLYFFKKHEVKTYCAITGFVLSSFIVILLQIKGFKFNFTTIFTSILTFLWGFLLSKNLEKE